MTKKREIQNFSIFLKKREVKILLFIMLFILSARFEDLNLLNINRYLENIKNILKIG